MVNVDPEISSFYGLWEGGFVEGNPLDRHSHSGYAAIDHTHGYPLRPTNIPQQELGFISVVYATYLMTIRKQVPRDGTVLEIGPGRGAWTKALLGEGPARIYALDALPAAHNGFWNFVGQTEKITYCQVYDFDCTPVPDNSIDFFFSFGTFCHISRRGTAAYFDSIARKMKVGAHGFCMISDYIKYNAAVGTNLVAIDESQAPSPGRWFHLGTLWFCKMLEDRGFEVVDPDLDIIARDPIVHFKR